DEHISADSATPKSSFFILFLLHTMVSGCTDFSGIPGCPGDLSRLRLRPGGVRLPERRPPFLKQMFRNERTKTYQQ
ncbi:MAG: hypothetical protein J0J15_33595, partial [Mesorhizobium sp.]|nr:hypothetical protein [Mesorhizobium sp.]